jgi:hypothetical protein
MRVIVPVVLFAFALLAVLSLSVARAAPEDVTPERIEALERRIRLLEDENAYLLGREAALTRAALAADPTGRNLVAGVEAARREGFELAAFPAPARAVMLRSLETLARDLAGAMPTPSAEEMRVAKDIANRRRTQSAGR